MVGRDVSGPFTTQVGLDDIVSRIRALPVKGPPEDQRAAFAELVLGAAAAAAAANEAPLRVRGHGGTIVYFHGGGYAFGSPQTHARIGHGLAERTGLDIMLPAYPLAPEHTWPTQLEAALAAVAEAQPPLVLAGDSAGGHLALVTALELGRRSARPAGLILFSPNTDRTGLSSTRGRYDLRDPMVDDEGDRELARQCFAGVPDNDPQVSPLLDDLTLLPPLHIEVGAGEVLLGDSLLLAQMAREAGRSVTLHVEADGLHMMQLWAPWWKAAAASLDRAATFALAVTGRRTMGWAEDAP